MDWLAPSNKVKNVEFYQMKALSFLFSPEGRNDLRSLNIPYYPLGFYNPQHFLSLIPPELSSQFSPPPSETVRKGDKVVLLERNSEGVVQSAVFKERRVRRSTGDVEILLEGHHRKAYSEDEVVPYKEYLRQQLGTALAPENRYVITEDGGLEWEEPTWEAGQEVYYTPEKRWATVLSHETNVKGKVFLIIKLDETPQRKPKTTRISRHELVQNSVPLRIPKIQGRDQVDATNASFDISDIENIDMADALYAEVMPKQYRKQKKDGPFSFVNSFLSAKPSSKRLEYYPPSPEPQRHSSKRPEYYPPSPEPPRHSTPAPAIHEIKSKSYNNLNALPDDDHFETNYAISLRTNAPKIIQTQIARESPQKAPDAAPKRPQRAKSLNRPLPSTPSFREEGPRRYYNPPPLPSLEYLRQKPLKYLPNLPLSTEQVRQQEYVVNRVLNGQQKENSTEYVVVKPSTIIDASNNINRSARYTPDILKGQHVYNKSIY